MTFFSYPIATVVIVAVITVLVTLVGGLATELGPWYRNLKKPAWQPPDFLFGPVWTIIFILVAYAAIDSHTNAPAEARPAIIFVFALNAFFNVLWSVLFFKVKSPLLALFEIVLLWLSIVSIAVVIYPYSAYGPLAVLPYLLWVSFAGFLNYTVVQLNAPQA